MARGKWFVQEYRSGNPKEPIYFPDFAATFAFVKAFTPEGAEDLLHVHVPAHGTDSERQELIDAGAVPG
jgi:hypothetical protein